jgi:SAM-dependent methyltransferase
MGEHYTVVESILMQQNHVPKWRAMIAAVTEHKTSNEVVLDHGCNLGGFLKLLYDERGFTWRRVDTEHNIIETARKEIGSYPIELYGIDDDDAGILNSSPDVFSLAFSHEVLHLVRDINEHAKLIKLILKDNGSYYAVRSFSKPEVWQMHKEKLIEKGLRPQYLTPDDIVDAFENAGFAVGAQLLPFNWFTPSVRKKRDEYFGLMGMWEHYSQRKILYRFTKL